MNFNFNGIAKRITKRITKRAPSVYIELFVRTLEESMERSDGNVTWCSNTNPTFTVEPPVADNLDSPQTYTMPCVFRLRKLLSNPLLFVLRCGL
jgi:hypothetical protein